MNARETIEALWDRAGVDISGLLNWYAHELAERIREACEGNGPDEDNWILNPFDAADLIDPEVN